MRGNRTERRLRGNGYETCATGASTSLVLITEDWYKLREWKDRGEELELSGDFSFPLMCYLPFSSVQYSNR